MWITYFLIIYLIQANNSEVHPFHGPVFCLKENELIGFQETLVVFLVEGSAGLLQCYHCNGKMSKEPQIWKRKNLLSFQNQDGQSSLIDLSFGGHFQENNERSLIIHNVSNLDVGVYMCIPPYDLPVEFDLKYLVDTLVTTNENISEWRGELSLWKNYSDTFLVEANQKLSEFTVPMLKSNSLIKMQFQVFSVWSEWMECDDCVKSSSMKRTAYCRLRSVPYRHKGTTNNLTILEENGIQIMFELKLSLPCRGFLASQLIPEFSGILQLLPDFIEESQCDGSCSKSLKNGEERRQLVLKEGDHAVVPCIGSIGLEAVRWEYNKRRMNMIECDGFVTIDLFGNLHFNSVPPSCAGNYMCYQVSTNFRLFHLKLMVSATSDKFWRAFARHAVYLGIVTIISSTTFLIINLSIYLRRKRINKKFQSNNDLTNPLLSSTDDTLSSAESE